MVNSVLGQINVAEVQLILRLPAGGDKLDGRLVKRNGGGGVLVAVLDGRADCRHPDLIGRCSNFLIPGGTYRRYDSHGTHTSGIVAGKKHGIAGSARILSYGVFDDRAYVATGTKLIDAWRSAGASGATIANMSFGCARRALCFTAAEVQAMADPNLKMLFVKAAGNDGTTLLTESIGVSAATAAAAMARVVLVGSVDVNGTISSFSNRPGETCLMYSGASGCSTDTLWKYHFIVAPGRNIYSTLPNGMYGYMSGTSMATPLTAGAVGVVREYLRKQGAADPSAALLKASLIAGAVRIGTAAAKQQVFDNDQGYGSVNVDNIVAPVSPLRTAFIDERTGVRTGEAKRYTMTLKANSNLRLVLAYSDYPGPALVNNLNLILISPTGKRYVGNQTSPTSLALDARNNVEVIQVARAAAGKWTVEVVGANVPQVRQDFALVCLGAITGAIVPTGKRR